MTAKRPNEMSMVAIRKALTMRGAEYAEAADDIVRAVWEALPPHLQQVYSSQASRTNVKRRPERQNDDHAKPTRVDAEE